MKKKCIGIGNYIFVQTVRCIVKYGKRLGREDIILLCHHMSNSDRKFFDKWNNYSLEERRRMIEYIRHSISTWKIDVSQGPNLHYVYETLDDSLNTFIENISKKKVSELAQEYEDDESLQIYEKEIVC